jgi:septal ring factor EnvC (AmiA/AmiB activator)
MPTPKIEAEQERVQAKFAEFKAGAKSLATDVRIEHARQVDDLEQRMNATKVKLKELSEADGPVNNFV